MFFNKISNLPKIQLLFGFSQTKKYLPMRPLIKERNPIYVDERFKKQGIIKSMPSIYWLGPPAIVWIHNYFTAWTTLSTGLFCFSALLGGITTILLNAMISQKVLCLQISRDLSKFYLMVPYLSKNQLLIIPKSSSFDELQKQADENFYSGFNPYLELYSDRFETLEVQKKRSMKMLLYRYVMRVQVDKSEITRMKLILNEAEQKQCNDDKEKLTKDEFIKKYENKMIDFRFRKGDKKFNWKIDLQSNAEKKYHDYLVCLAAGIEIEETRIKSKEINEEEKKQN